MRNGFKEDNSQSATRPAPLTDFLTEKTESALHHEPTVADRQLDNAVWQEVRTELYHQNLFGPRQYCRWMTIATLALTIYRLPMVFWSFYNPRVPIGSQPNGLEIASGLLPFLCWTIAYILFYTGSMNGGISDRTLSVTNVNPSEIVLSETEIREAAIRARDNSKKDASRGTIFLWLGIALNLVVPMIAEWIKAGMR